MPFDRLSAQVRPFKWAQYPHGVLSPSLIHFSDDAWCISSEEFWARQQPGLKWRWQTRWGGGGWKAWGAGGGPLVKEKYSIGDLLWLNVYELSRLLSCCKRACIIPALLRDTGRVWDFRSCTTGPAPSWFLMRKQDNVRQQSQS